MHLFTTIRARLYLLAFLALVPLLAMFGHAARAIHRVREESELASNLELARATGAAFAAFVRDVSRTSVAIGEVLASGRLPPGEADELLRRAVRPYVAIREFSWATPDGLIRESSNPAAVGVGIGDRDYFLRLRAGDEEALSDLLHSRTRPGDVVVVARAVRDGSGRMLGAVLATISPELLDEKTLTMRRVGDGAFALVDRNGRLVFRSPTASSLSWDDREVASRQPLVRRALDGEEAMGTFVSEVGDERLGAAVPIPGLGWAARATRSTAEAFGPVRREFARAGVVALLAAALSLVASALVGRRIVRTLGRLELHAEALGRGERVDPPTTSAPEIARLARAQARMADQLRASREAFVAAFDAAPAGIVLLDGDTLRARWANRAYLDFLDEPHRRRGVAGEPVEAFVEGAEERGLSRTIERIARGDLPHSDWEHRHDGRGGTSFWRWSVRPIPSADRVGGRDVLLIGTDVTAQVVARKRAEDQALENARLFEEARRAVQGRDEVLSVVSHDLRNPLGAITLSAHVLEALPDAPGSLDRARSTARRILAAGDRMGRLIGDLLDLASLQEGRLALDRKPCAPADLLAEAMEEGKGPAKEKGLELRCRAEPGLPPVACDRGRILQVVGNLVSNAVKVTERGEIRLSAARGGSDDVVFSVQDSGPGIPEGERDHLFERFRRGAGATYRGTGLGLAISRELVEAHGGRIWIEGAPGQGATLRFTLPAAKEARAAPPEADEGQAGGCEAGPGAGADAATAR